MSKSYKIETTEDILKAVNSKNINGFLKDFEEWLRLTVMVKESVPDNPYVKLKTSLFTWNDDGNYGTVKTVTFSIQEGATK